jgi:hypothetical protein
MREIIIKSKYPKDLLPRAEVNLIYLKNMNEESSPA